MDCMVHGVAKSPTGLSDFHFSIPMPKIESLLPLLATQGHDSHWLDKQHVRSLVIQWLRLCALNAGGPGLIPGRGTRSHMPQLKIS